MNTRGRVAAFTLVELLIVVLVLAISAAIIIPGIGTAADSQAISAARVLESDLEMARSLAITTQQPHSVVFSTDRQSYKVVVNYTGGGYASAVAVDHPVRSGAKLQTTLATAGGMSGVHVASAFGSSGYLTFTATGDPDPSTGGTVALESGDYQMQVKVESLTGAVTVTHTGG